MKVTINSSASQEDIKKIYLDESRKVISYLADQGYELNWGSGKFCIMGICYDEFSKRGIKINGYTTKKYVFELEDLPKAEHKILDDTFELKKALFNEADVVIYLPGGTGTVSEFFCNLEEVRSNDKNQKLVIYNIDGWFNNFLEGIKFLVDEKLNTPSTYDSYYVVNTYEEFVDLFEKIKADKVD